MHYPEAFSSECSNGEGVFIFLVWRVDPVVYSNFAVAAVPICFTPLPTIISRFSAKTPHPCMYIFVVAEAQMNGVPPLNFEVSRLGTLDFSLFLLQTLKMVLDD